MIVSPSTIILLVIKIFIVSSAIGQEIKYNDLDSSIVAIKKYYRGLGKVFTEKDSVVFPDKSILNLSINEVVSTEEIFLKGYNKILYPASQSSMSKNLNVKKKFNQYYRQYLAFENSKSERTILIVLLNFSNKKQAEKYFHHWKKDVEIYNAGDFYERNRLFFLVNLESKSLLLPYESNY